MARTAIAVTTLAGRKNPANVEIATLTAGDDSNHHGWAAKVGDILLVHNTGTGAVGVELQSVADDLGRVEHEAASIGADDYWTFGPFTDLRGWQQSDGTIHFDIDSGTGSDLNLAVLRK